jgi:hypothetical protein
LGRIAGIEQHLSADICHPGPIPADVPEPMQWTPLAKMEPGFYPVVLRIDIVEDGDLALLGDWQVKGEQVVHLRTDEYFRDVDVLLRSVIRPR